MSPFEETLAKMRAQRDEDPTYYAYAQANKLEAIVKAVVVIAFDPDTVSALENGAIEFGPNIYEAVSVGDALGYARDALRDIRTAIEEGLST